MNKRDEAIALVTFNCDLLLDHALESFGYHLPAPATPLAAHPILKLFKPHGSVDWARVVKLAPSKPIPDCELIEKANTLAFTGEFIRRGNPTEADSGPYVKISYPAIAIPVQNKTDDTFACPRHHLKGLVEIFPSVTKILIVGWQAKEAHFLKLLREQSPRLTHVMVGWL
jgi:hypothetical protein